MPTPRKPGAKRGRPSLKWVDDPDRYAVALVAALDALEAANITQTSLLAATLMLCKHVGGPEPDLDEPGLVRETFERIRGPGESVATEEGRATSLRQKYHEAEHDPEARRWLIAVAGIFMLLIGARRRYQLQVLGGNDGDQIAREALRRAAEIGEESAIRAFIQRLQPLDGPNISSGLSR